MKLETPIGEFTTDSYKIPAEDTLAVSPAIISFSSDDYKIITIDQFIQISTDVYTPLLHQNFFANLYDLFIFIKLLKINTYSIITFTFVKIYPFLC